MIDSFNDWLIEHLIDPSIEHISNLLIYLVEGPTNRPANKEVGKFLFQMVQFEKSALISQQAKMHILTYSGS